MRIVMFARVPRWYSFREDRMTNRLLSEGVEIAGIVAERTRTRDAFRDWMFKLGPRVVFRKLLQKGLSISGLRRGRHATQKTASGSGSYPTKAVTPPPVHFVASHNSPECVEIVRRLRPELIVLRGCGIVKKQTLEIPSVGTINPHYALLPDYRGMDVTEWSVLHGAPAAVSVHWVSEDVDTGAVIISRRINVERGDTLGVLREKSAALASELMTEAIKRIESGDSTPSARKNIEGRQYFTMHPRLRQLAEFRLK
ncbi:MAG: formyl transferase [Blastocatellales bacterium]